MVSTADSLGEGSGKQNAAGDVDRKGHANAVSDGDEDSLGDWSKGHPCYLVAKSLASLCPCPEASWKAKLPSDQLVCLATELSKQKSIQAAAWLLLTAYSQMREQRDDLKTELLKRETEQPRQRRNHQGLKRKGWPQQPLVKNITVDRRMLLVLNPGNKRDGWRGSQKGAPMQTGESGLPAKRSSTSVMIPKAPDAAPVNLRPWQRSCTGDFAGRKNLVTKSQQPSAQLTRKPWEARTKAAFRRESLRKGSDEVIPRGAVEVKPHWRSWEKSTDTSVLKHQPQKAASSVTHRPLKAENISLQPEVAAVRVEPNRAWRLLSRPQGTPGSTPEVESLQRAHTEARPSRNVQTELRPRGPSSARPTGVTGLGLPWKHPEPQSSQHGGASLGELRKGDSSL